MGKSLSELDFVCNATTLWISLRGVQVVNFERLVSYTECFLIHTYEAMLTHQISPL